jgi:hypothetical protein
MIYDGSGQIIAGGGRSVKDENGKNIVFRGKPSHPLPV